MLGSCGCRREPLPLSDGYSFAFSYISLQLPCNPRSSFPTAPCRFTSWWALASGSWDKGNTALILNPLVHVPRAQWAPDGFSLSSEICLKKQSLPRAGITGIPAIFVSPTLSLRVDYLLRSTLPCLS